MSIYLNQDSKIIVQGMTGGMGSKHTALMLDAGSNIVGGVNARMFFLIAAVIYAVLDTSIRDLDDTLVI